MHKILLVEDDVSLGKSVSQYLKQIGYNVIWAQTGVEAFKMVGAENIQLCLMDIGIPERDGFEVTKDIKKLNTDIPIIFLTARNQINDKIRAFQLGCDDYVCKPFLMQELELRIQAVAKRFKSDTIQQPVYEYKIGLFTFNFIMRTLELDGRKEKLSHIDCELLKLLYASRGKFMSKETILKAIWGHNDLLSSKRLSVYLARIRKLLQRDASIQIENVYGFGYKLVTD
jgi:DNA-binding response OmpR family regulator